MKVIANQLTVGQRVWVFDVLTKTGYVLTITHISATDRELSVIGRDHAGQIGHALLRPTQVVTVEDATGNPAGGVMETEYQQYKRYVRDRLHEMHQIIEREIAYTDALIDGRESYPVIRSRDEAFAATQPPSADVRQDQWFVDEMDRQLGTAEAAVTTEQRRTDGRWVCRCGAKNNGRRECWNCGRGCYQSAKQPS